MTEIHPFHAREGGVTERPRAAGESEPGLLTPAELSRWLEDRRGAIADRWLLELRTRSGDPPAEVLPLLEDFLDLLVALLPPGLGAYREQAQLLFQDAAALFGNLGAHRGQAAGEPVEEFQLLREVILRFLHLDPPGEGLEDLGLRELLQLNRLIDVGVAYASVGHTDILFFNLFHGTGVNEVPTPELLTEVREQVEGIREELTRLLRHAARADGANGA